MTLDKTIKEAKITSVVYENEARKCAQHNNLFHKEKARMFRESAKEFEQIAEWLKELKAYRTTDRSQGEWIKKPHKVYLPRDYEPDIIDYRDRQYNEEDHSIIQYWWHCNQCNYEADRWMKPTFNFCPNCGADMRNKDDE